MVTPRLNAIFSALGVPTVNLIGRPPRAPAEKTEVDEERLKAAEEKRARKAARNKRIAQQKSTEESDGEG